VDERQQEAGAACPLAAGLGSGRLFDRESRPCYINRLHGKLEDIFHNKRYARNGFADFGHLLARGMMLLSMEQQEQMELDFEFIETNLPGGRKLLRMEKTTIGQEGFHRDNWFVVEKFAANGWTFISADNDFYYLEKLL